MLSIVLTLAAMNDDGCPSCPKAAPPTCHALCQCAFPGHCGHTGCTCKAVGGVQRPPIDRWVPFTANPAYEVYGHEVDGVFRYTHLRPKARTAPAPSTHGGATFVICRHCGQTQFLVHEHQQCNRCRMFLARPTASAAGCVNGRCGR